MFCEPDTCPHCGNCRLAWSSAPYFAPDVFPGLVLHGARQCFCEVCGAQRLSIPRLSPLLRSLARWTITQTSVLSAGQLDFLRRWMGWSPQEAQDLLHLGPGEFAHERRGPAQMLLRLLVAQQLGPAAVAALTENVTLAHWGTMPLSTVWLRAQYLEGTRFWLLRSTRDAESARAEMSAAQLADAAACGAC